MFSKGGRQLPRRATALLGGAYVLARSNSTLARTLKNLTEGGEL